MPERFLVIDGQQRLVTLSILLCVLRDIAENQGLSVFADSLNDYLTFTTPRGEAHTRLVPRSVDKLALEKVIQHRVMSQDKKPQIIKAYKYYKREVKKGLQSHEHEVIDYLDDLLTVIIARLKFVSITLERKDDPTKIYESMNFKGKVLLVADLIRNFALMQLQDNGAQDVFFANEWEPFESLFADKEDNSLNAKELEDFYYRYLIARTEYFAKRQVYSTYKGHWWKNFETGIHNGQRLTSLSLLVADQKQYATFYRRIMHPNHELDEELKEAFKRFAYLDALTATPFIMALYSRYNDTSDTRQISKEVFLEMLNALESFIIRRSFFRLRTRGYSLDFAQAISKSASVEELWTHFDNRGWPKDDAIRKELIEFPLYLRERKKARLILEELEKSFGHKEQIDLSASNKIQIEHILPQKKELSPEWMEMLGEGASKIHEKYRDTLGNLTLTGYNKELGAKSFHEKKFEYSKHGTGSHIELNTYVLEQEQWTESEISERAHLLIDRFIEIWPRPKISKQNED